MNKPHGKGRWKKAANKRKHARRKEDKHTALIEKLKLTNLLMGDAK